MKKLKGYSVMMACLPLALMALGLVLVSCQEPDSGTTYTVTFNANGGGGTVPGRQTVQVDSSITLPSGSGLTKAGYTFSGWNTDADGTGTNYSAVSSFTPSGNVTLYARWIAEGTNFTVTFDVNGGDGTAPNQKEVPNGSSITLPPGNGLTKTGYIFGGWNTDSDGTGTNYSADSFYIVTGNITLYARWIDEDATNFTVTFDINGGSGTAPDQRKVLDGSSITLPSGSGLTKTDYIFGGWNTDHGGTGTNYSAGESFTPSGDVVLYAKWNVDSLSISGLANKLAWLQANAQSNNSYTLEVDADEGINPSVLSYGGRSNIAITLIGADTNRTVSLSSNGAMFVVGPGVMLVLDNNITLQGRSENSDSLVKVNPGGTLEMKDGANITENVASASGGGVYVGGGGTFTMSGGEIFRNYGYGNGGGVYVDGNGTFTMESGKISGNIGSGVYVDGNGTFTMSGGEISGNIGGSGVYVNSGTFTMNDGEISGNTADYYGDSNPYGGGVYVNGTFTMEGGEISGNTAYSRGGGVCVNGTFTMSGGEISGNTASGSVFSYGGGVYMDGGGTFTMSGGEISDNSALCSNLYPDVIGRAYGGGVYMDGGGTFTMNNGEISGNTASDIFFRSYSYGGGVYAFAGTFTMESGEISGNTASYGGGVCVDSSSGTFTMNGGEISGNTADYYGGNPSGGGVYVGDGGTFTMNGGEISGNTAASPGNTATYGGGVCVDSSGTFTMSGGEISGNTATNSGDTTTRGGGVYVNGTFTMESGKISGNTASSSASYFVFSSVYGGGVCVGSSGTFTMNGGEISGNTASVSVFSVYGGGVCVDGSGTFTMNGGEISGNTISSPTPSNTATRGGGVGGVTGNGIFIKNGGTIYGYDANDTVNSNVVKDSSGAVQNFRGHAVWVDSNSGVLRRETTAGPEVDLSNTPYSGEWED